MKFAIFAGSFAPDWLIVSIEHLSTLTSLRLKLLTKAICAHLLTTTPSDSGSVMESPGFNSELSPSEVKGCVAALTFITVSATRVLSSSFGDGSPPLSPTVITAELHQLGLPQESAEGFSKIYDEFSSRLVQWNLEVMCRGANRMDGVKWRVVYDAAVGGYGEGVGQAETGVNVKVSLGKAGGGRINFGMDLEKFDELKAELEVIKSIVDDQS